MTYTYENAKKICKFYSYLVGKHLDDANTILEEAESIITDICIIPFDQDRRDDFFDYYKTENAQGSLFLAGYNIYMVRVVAIFEQTLTAPGLMLDLDEYLTKHNLQKKYDKDGVFIEENINVCSDQSKN